MVATFDKSLYHSRVFIRYKTDGDGKSIPIAKIYTNKEHPIKNSMIDRDALWAIRKLQASGAEAYVVGGSIRDLMLGRMPKDFDIATSASPRQVQRLFWNSRIIGKRFRIVHLFFGEKIIEVTTFRSDEENFEEGNNNVFGTIEQDAKRRDFSINALYYNPQNGQVLDFCSGMEDFEKKLIRSLIPLKYSFTEDPVRMLRAIKYHVTTGFALKWNVKLAIKKNAPSISSCSTSRMTEEIMKILSSGCSAGIMQSLYKHKLLQYMLPCYSVYVNFPAVIASLKELDNKVLSGKEEGEKVSKSDMFYYMLKPAIVFDKIEDLSNDEIFRDVFRQAKVLISPATPPNYELEKAAGMFMADHGYSTNRVRKPNKKRIQSGKNMRKAGEGAASTRKKNRKKNANKGPQVLNSISKQDGGPKTLAESHDL